MSGRVLRTFCPVCLSTQLTPQRHLHFTAECVWPSETLEHRLWAGNLGAVLLSAQLCSDSSINLTYHILPEAPSVHGGSTEGGTEPQRAGTWTARDGEAGFGCLGKPSSLSLSLQAALAAGPPRVCSAPLHTTSLPGSMTLFAGSQGPSCCPPVGPGFKLLCICWL